MTVRWKPLLFLSGVFLVVGLIGVVAIVRTLVPRSAQDTLKWARAAREAGRFEDAEIYFKQAIQKDADDAAIHEEFAGLYRDWSRQAVPRKAGPQSFGTSTDPGALRQRPSSMTRRSRDRAWSCCKKRCAKMTCHRLTTGPPKY